MVRKGYGTAGARIQVISPGARRGCEGDHPQLPLWPAQYSAQVPYATPAMLATASAPQVDAGGW